jgi:hypothetical protein
MSYFHGQGGHCNRHFKKAGWSTEVQPDTSREDELRSRSHTATSTQLSETRNELNRVDPELCDRSGGGDGLPDYHFPVFQYSCLAIRYWAHCLDLHWHFHRSLLRAATAV